MAEDDNFSAFLINQVRSIFRAPSSYVILVCAALAFGFYWKEHGFTYAFRLLVVLANGFATTFILTQLFILLLYKEIKRNAFVMNLIVVVGLSCIILYYFNEELLYWSFLAGTFFMLPVAIGVIVARIKSR